MKLLNGFIDIIRDFMKALVGRFAIVLNTLSGGKLSPDVITLIGLFTHVPIALLIAMRQNYWAAGLLITFGLFDSLDGALARLQKTAGSRGMLLDASTDRIKEVILYTGAAYALVAGGYPFWTIWAVAACGASLVVSYVKAKGETAITGGNLTANEINRLFADGLMRFEVRMTILFVSLLANQLRFALIFIAITSGITAVGRLVKISSKL